MASKTHLNKLIQISNNEEAALANINANVDILNDVIDDYVSRSGAVPTQMQTTLDMGSQKIINVLSFIVFCSCGAVFIEEKERKHKSSNIV